MKEYMERLRGLMNDRHFDPVGMGSDPGNPVAVKTFKEERLRRELQYFKDHRAEGTSIIELIVRTPPVVPDWSVMTGIPKERYREYMRGTMIDPGHPDAETF